MNALEKRRLLQARRERERLRRKGGGGAKRVLLILALGLFSLLAVGAAAGAGVVFSIYQDYADDYVPIEEKLAQTAVGLTTIYDRNGIELGQLPNPDAQLLNPVGLDRISKAMIDATISTEDNTFWDNPGINYTGLSRAAMEYLTSGGDTSEGTGGSSITQQLIKNVYICPSIITEDDPQACQSAERTVDRKMREIVYALELEKDYTKEQILEWYLNQISYADRYIGVQAAAQGYFHKDASELTLGEAALLAGIPSAPTRYHPRLNAVTDENGTPVLDDQGRMTVGGDAKLRQEDVLDLMLENEIASPVEIDAAKAEVIAVYPASSSLKAAAFIDNQVQPRLERMCEAGILPQTPGSTDCYSSVNSGGYKVTTTLDYAETETAQVMIRQWLADGQGKGCNCYNAAIATIDPTTGQILIYAPNSDPSYVSDKRVAGDIDQLSEINQPGSSFKPIVYLAWFDRLNKAPMSTFWDTSPLTLEGVSITNPRSDGRSGEGMITAYWALGNSQNIAAFRAATEVGAEGVIEVAKAMGITTLDQNFDPTFFSHENVQYGSSIATGGANIRAIDLAYMNATIANMGRMVGVPTYAETLDYGDLLDTSSTEGLDYDAAREQALQFSRGNNRLPGTRELDPVTVLRVEGRNGEVLYDHDAAKDLEERQVVDAGSVWLLHSIMSDCDARRLLWGCGSSNTDNLLDVIVDGEKVPGGVKTGTQQGPLSAVDTLETWTNGYSRYAGTAVWVGNANNELVMDGPSVGYASANTTVKLFKNWMAEYHSYLLRNGRITAIDGFSDLQPGNVAQVAFPSTATDRGNRGGCDQTVTGWKRTDVEYASECEQREVDSRNGLLAGPDTPQQFRALKKFVKLPTFKPDLAIELARRNGIPIAPTEVSTGRLAVSISSPANGRTISSPTPVVGSVEVTGLRGWTLELSGPGGSKSLGTGSGNVSETVLGTIDPKDLPDGVYTIRLTAEGSAGSLASSVTINVKKAPDPTATPSRTPTPGGGTPTPVQTTGPEVTPQTPVPD